MEAFRAPGPVKATIQMLSKNLVTKKDNEHKRICFRLTFVEVRDTLVVNNPFKVNVASQSIVNNRGKERYAVELSAFHSNTSYHSCFRCDLDCSDGKRRD